MAKTKVLKVYIWLNVIILVLMIVIVFHESTIGHFFQYTSVQSSTRTKELINKYKVDWNYTLSEDPWIVAQNWLTGRHVHPEDTPELGAVLRSLATSKIISADTFDIGHHLKLIIYLEGGQKTVFRPKMYERDAIVKYGSDRHNGAIAAYHVQRILNFHRGPLVVGRYIDAVSEILPVATDRLKKTFTSDKDGNICLNKYGDYKKTITACANGTIFEGSMCLWLPIDVNGTRTPWPNVGSKIDAKTLCNRTTKFKTKYGHPSLLMDLIDTAIFDYLIGRGYRHTQYPLKIGNETMLVLIDNAKCFGIPYLYEEALFNLRPLSNCCRLRESTWKRMLYLQGILGDVLKGVLDQDPIAPVLTQDHLDGLNRRLNVAINAARECIDHFGATRVLGPVLSNIDSLKVS